MVTHSAGTLAVPLYEVEKAAKPAVVCVTGITGYVAGHVVVRLLAAGHTVHGTCRNPEKAETVEHLTSLPGAKDRLNLFKADLLTPGSFDEAVKGCEFVIHTASPFLANVSASQAQERLIKPALLGTSNVLGESWGLTLLACTN